MTSKAKSADRDSTQEVADGESIDFRILLQSNHKFIEQWAQGITVVWREVSQFTQKRLHADTTAWTELVTTRDPQAMLDCQRRHAEQAAAEYSDLMTKLPRLLTNLATESWASIQKGQAPSAES
jgi:hypothetical protein